MRRDADIVVVGAGIAGVATARALADSLRSVVLLEQYELGHARGSSHGTSRIHRLNYGDQRFVRLAQAAGDAWRALEEERGEQLLQRVGVLDLGPAAPATARALAACGVPYQTLSREQVAARWPLRLESGETAVYQRNGGFLYADRAHAALLAAAVDGGVDVRERSPVLALELGRGAVHVSVDGEEIVAGAVVVTAGAWAPRLLATVGIELPVVPTRETVVYLDLPGAEALPPVIDYGGVPAPGEGGIARPGNSTFSLAAPGRGLKAGLHHAGPVADPDEAGVADESVADWVAGWAASRYVDAGARQAAETCIYTNTADETFVLERHGRVVVGSACSGHGFKFGPVVGRTPAALAASLLMAGCTGSDADDETGTTTAGTTPTMSSVAVYLLRDGKVAPVRRTIEATPAVARAALTSLLDGPTDGEKAAGLATAIPATTTLRDISLSGGVATVDLGGVFGDGAAGTALEERVAQVVATLTRFPTIRGVAFRLDGEPVTTIGGEGGIPVSPPLGRKQIEGQTPQILVESPLPGDRITSPIRVRGTANVFEATISFEVRDEGENIVRRSFTTATSGTGTRGTFETELAVPKLEGRATIVAFEASAEDGSPLHVAEVPVLVDD